MNDHQMRQLAAYIKQAMDAPTPAQIQATYDAAETGSRYGYARVKRGYSLDGTTINRLYDAAPPLNPATGVPWKGAIIDAGRGPNGAGVQVGYQVGVTVGDSTGGRAYREFVIGPGSPVYLALGQYQSVKVNVLRKSQADGTIENAAARIQWTDWMPSLPDAGLLRSPNMRTGVAPVEQQVPDGAISMWVQQTCTVTWNDYSAAGGAALVAPDIKTVVPLNGEIIRTQGQGFTTSIATNVQFYLAGL